MKGALHAQVNRIVGPHANDPCIPWDSEQVPKFRSKGHVPASLHPVSEEIVDRHPWVTRGCLTLTRPNRAEGEELGQNVWLGVFKALVTPGHPEVQSLHAFIGGVMENQLIKQVRGRGRTECLQPLTILTPDGEKERPELVDGNPAVDEQAWRATAMDILLTKLDVFDRILVIAFAERVSFDELRLSLIRAGDPRVTPNTPASNLKTYQNTALRRAAKLLGADKEVRGVGRSKK